MPKKKTPIEVRRRTGNPGKRPLPDPANVVQLRPVVDVPTPGRPLNEAGLAAWWSAWEEAGAWLAPSDAEMVLLYAETVDDYTAIRDELRVLGFSDPAWWRLRKQVIDFGTRVSRLAEMLGLSPSARAQLGVAEVRVAETIADMLERRDSSRRFERVITLPGDE